MQDGNAAGAAAGLGLTAADITQLRAAPATGTVTVAGVTLDAATGEVATGRLAPANAPIDLPAEVAGIVRSADETLDLDVINARYNPFAKEPKTADGQPLIGPYADASRIFTSKTILPLRQMAAGLGEGIAPLAARLSEFLTFDTPAHQFNVPGGIGNRVIFYGGGIDTAHIDLLTHAMRRRNMRLLKAMTHLDDSCAGPRGNGGSQGGMIDRIASDGVGGTTHLGGFSAGYSKLAGPVAVQSDWPSNYGHLNDSNDTYNAHILAIDYSKGTHDPIPDVMLDAYCRNADMWDACAGMLVPFVSEGEIDPGFADYEYNPLDVYDQGSARTVAAALARLDQRQFLIAHGAFYCAEGQYCVANLGPQEDADGGTLLKRSRFGSTPFGKLIDSFAEAPGYKDADGKLLPLEERRQKPWIGWDHLRKLGPENGGISGQQHGRLAATKRLSIHLEWLPEDIKGWQAYRPRNPDGLIARPMTVATLAWSHFRRYLPREALARAIAAEIRRLIAQEAPELRQLLVALTGCSDLTDRVGRMAVSLVSAKLAAALIGKALAADAARSTIMQKAGRNEMPLEADRKALEGAYESMIQLVQANALAPQEVFDQALLEADRKLAGLKVTRNQFDKSKATKENAELIAKLMQVRALATMSAEQRAGVATELIQQIEAQAPQVLEAAKALYREVPGTMMLYAAPSCFIAWAQQPFLADTGCIRYVATAMHVAQSRHFRLGSVLRGNAEPEPGITPAAQAREGRIWSLFGQTFVAKDVSEACFSWYALVPPGAALPLQTHAAQDKFIYVLDAELTVTIGDQERKAGPADLVRLPRGVAHAYRNAGSRPVHALLWVSPSLRLHQLFDQLTGIADPATIAQLCERHERSVTPQPPDEPTPDEAPPPAPPQQPEQAAG